MEVPKHGYHVDFVTAPPDYLRCMICQLVLRDPVQIMTCGHHYCQHCFQRVKGYSIVANTPLRCPIDQNVVDLEKVFRDISISRVISGLKVKCTFTGRGCEWIGELGNLGTHKSKCAHVLNNVSSLSNQAGVSNPSSDAMLDAIVQRLCHCESSLTDNEKELANIKFQLRETKELIARRDEEIELLKERILKCEQLNVQEEIKKGGHQKLLDVEKVNKEIHVLSERITECHKEHKADAISYRICIGQIDKLKTDKVDDSQLSKLVKDLHGVKAELRSLKSKFPNNADVDSLQDDVMFIPNVRHKKTTKSATRKPATDSVALASKQNLIKTNSSELPKKKKSKTKKTPDSSPKTHSDGGGLKGSKCDRLVKFDVAKGEGKRHKKTKELKLGGMASWSCPVLNVLDPDEVRGPEWTCAKCKLSNRPDDVECASCGAWVL